MDESVGLRGIGSFQAPDARDLLIRIFRGLFLFVCHLTGITHSGGDAHFGKDISLQQKPYTDKTEKYQNLFQTNTSFFKEFSLVSSSDGI